MLIIFNSIISRDITRQMMLVCCVVNRPVTADVNSPSEDLRDAAWYQPGIPRLVTYVRRLPLLICVAGDSEDKLSLSQ